MRDANIYIRILTTSFILCKILFGSVSAYADVVNIPPLTYSCLPSPMPTLTVFGWIYPSNIMMYDAADAALTTISNGTPTIGGAPTTEAQCIDPTATPPNDPNTGAPAYAKGPPPNRSMYTADSSGVLRYLGCPYPTISRCLVPSTDIYFTYKTFGSLFGSTIGYNGGKPSPNHCSDTSKDRKGTICRTVDDVVRARNIGANVCLEGWTPEGWIAVGCKRRYIPLPPRPPSPCYIAQSCASSVNTHSRVSMPIASKVVECGKDTLNTLVNPDPSCPYLQFFANLQSKIRNTVLAALTLYVCIFSLNLMLSGEQALKRKEFFVFIIKIILVIYFSIGFMVGGTSLNGVAMLSNAAIAAAESFSMMMMHAGNGNGLCYFDSAGYEAGYSHLALWDAMDCRVAYYLGMQSGGIPTIMMVLVPILLGMFVGMFNIAIVFVILMFALAIMTFQTIIHVVHTFLIALFAITFLTFLAPIFVPMALFKITHSYFQGWLKLIISYSIQPVVLVAFLGFMLTVYDGIIYGTCTFDPVVTQNWLTGNEVLSFTLHQLQGVTVAEQMMNTQTAQIENSCYNSLGYQLNYLFSAQQGVNMLTSALLVLFPMPIFTNPSLIATMFNALIQVMFFAYLFHYFVKLLDGLAADLTGGAALGNSALSATIVTDTVNKVVKTVVLAVADRFTGGAASVVAEQLEEGDAGNAAVANSTDRKDTRGGDDNAAGGGKKEDEKPGGKDGGKDGGKAGAGGGGKAGAPKVPMK